MGSFTSFAYETCIGDYDSNKLHVYYCAHPDDYNQYIDEIKKNIFVAKPESAFIYHEDTDFDKYDSEDIEEVRNYILSAHIIVIPITRKFLSEKNFARDEEFAEAVRNNIPLIPIMEENGLEADFNRICGNYQTLNPNISDATAISFTEKLKNFITMNVLDEETVNAVRSAYDACIFLSYRKKDRRYVKDIMHALHSDDRFIGASVWYDEFLSPGEDFNDAIKAAFDRSSLFALMVTPSLLEEGNYVMDVEYPMACRSGIEILPIETAKTPRRKLEKYYPGLSQCYSCTKTDHIIAVLERTLPAGPTDISDIDRDRLYLLGLGYLYGIDVEKDYDMAVRLLEKAADKGHLYARRKLWEIYRDGIGVETDTDTAFMYHNRYKNQVVDLYCSESCEDFSECKDEDFFFRTMMEYIDATIDRGWYNSASEILISMCKALDVDLKDENHYYGMIEALIEKAKQTKDISDLIDVSEIFLRLAKIKIKTGDYTYALLLLDDAEDIISEMSEYLASEEDLVEYKLDLYRQNMLLNLKSRNFYGLCSDSNDYIEYLDELAEKEYRPDYDYLMDLRYEALMYSDYGYVMMGYPVEKARMEYVEEYFTERYEKTQLPKYLSALITIAELDVTLLQCKDGVTSDELTPKMERLLEMAQNGVCDGDMGESRMALAEALLLGVNVARLMNFKNTLDQFLELTFSVLEFLMRQNFEDEYSSFEELLDRYDGEDCLCRYCEAQLIQASMWTEAKKYKKAEALLLKLEARLDGHRSRMRFKDIVWGEAEYLRRRCCYELRSLYGELGKTDKQKEYEQKVVSENISFRNLPLEDRLGDRIIADAHLLCGFNCLFADDYEGFIKHADIVDTIADYYTQKSTDTLFMYIKAFNCKLRGEYLCYYTSEADIENAVKQFETAIWAAESVNESLELIGMEKDEEVNTIIINSYGDLAYINAGTDDGIKYMQKALEECLKLFGPKDARTAKVRETAEKWERGEEVVFPLL